jgi:hypothetical protein
MVLSRELLDEEPDMKPPSWPARLKDIVRTRIASESEELWRSVFSECDCDNDGQLERRELLVLMQRLNLDIPSDEELTAIINKFDVDENGSIDYDEFCAIVRDLGVRRQEEEAARGFRAAVREHLEQVGQPPLSSQHGPASSLATRSRRGGFGDHALPCRIRRNVRSSCGRIYSGG